MTQHNPATMDPMEIMVANATTREELADKLGLRDLSPQDVTREVLEETSLRVIKDQILLLFKELTPPMKRELALQLMEEAVHEVTGDVQGVHTANDMSDQGGIH